MIEWKPDTLEAFDFYNISPDKAEWISYKEFYEAPIEEVNELVDKYRFISLPSEAGKLFLVER